MKAKRSIGLLIIMLALSGCGGGSGGDDSGGDGAGNSAPNANTEPVANAGKNQNVVFGDTVALDGSGSSDADGDLLTYQWKFVSCPTRNCPMLRDAKTASPEFEAYTTGDYVVQLIVNDSSTDSEPDKVTITVTRKTIDNSVPVADAGADRNVVVGDTVALDGSGSSDADGDLLTYQWKFASCPTSSCPTLSDADTVSPEFIPNAAGDYEVQLVVNDGSVDSEPNQVMVTATSANSANSAPNADAGPDQNVSTGASVDLDGTGSSDPDGDSLSYHWTFVSIPSGSSASLTHEAIATPAFTPYVDGEYVMELVVTDASGTSDSDRVIITTATVNSAPVADAGSDQFALIGKTVTLDGSASNDADGDDVTYHWRFVSCPKDSCPTLTGANTVSPKIMADTVGNYVVRLKVKDGHGGVDSDTVTVNFTPVVLRKFNPATGLYEAVAPTYVSTANITIPEGGPSKKTLGRFQLAAKGQNYTIGNIFIVSVQHNPPISGSVEGISDGARINGGGEVNFALTTTTNGNSNDVYALSFRFRVVETGEKFSATYRLKFN